MRAHAHTHPDACLSNTHACAHTHTPWCFLSSKLGHSDCALSIPETKSRQDTIPSSPYRRPAHTLITLTKFLSSSPRGQETAKKEEVGEGVGLSRGSHGKPRGRVVGGCGTCSPCAAGVGSSLTSAAQLSAPPLLLRSTSTPLEGGGSSPSRGATGPQTACVGAPFNLNGVGVPSGLP